MCMCDKNFWYFIKIINNNTILILKQLFIVIALTVLYYLRQHDFIFIYLKKSRFPKVYLFQKFRISVLFKLRKYIWPKKDILN